MERRCNVLEEGPIKVEHDSGKEAFDFQAIVGSVGYETVEIETWTGKLFRAPACREGVLESRRMLRGERLLLRPLASTDLRRCVKWFSDPQVIYFLGRNSPITLAEEERWFRDYERRTDEQIFAIEVASTHVGNLGLHKIDRTHKKADVGIVIGESAYWSKGYGTEAMRIALRYAFGELGLNKVSLDVLEYNTRAIRTYERLGFQPEGLHREDIYKDGRFVNVLRMGILAREMRDDRPSHTD